MNLDFTNKVVLITGGSRGLGHAMSLGFARAGANVAVASRKIDACEATVAEIKALGRDGSAHSVHVARWDDCDRLADEVLARWGKVDVLINNAGMSPVAPSSLATNEDLYDKVLGINLKGPFRLTARLASHMVENGGGSVINVSSIAAIRPTPWVAPYAAAKAGLNALTVAFAKEYGPSVRVNCIMCGPFRTDVSKGWYNDDWKEQAKKDVAMQRIGEPEEVVGAALYLAGPASSYTTGAVLTVDGGAS
jgi:NAD(P)-dependent dehydrogenase (short-subunit alcohol dehydrogenase family)